MANDAAFSITFGPGISNTDVAALQSALAQQATVQETPVSRDPVTAAATIVVIMGAISATVGTVKVSAEAAKAIAEAITAWRLALEQRSTTPEATLQRPSQLPLDLASASDTEVMAWLLASPG